MVERKRLVIQDLRSLFPEVIFHIHDLFDLVQEPRIDLGQREYLLNAHPCPQPVGNVPDPFPVRYADFLADIGYLVLRVPVAVPTGFKTVAVYLERPERLLERLP